MSRKATVAQAAAVSFIKMAMPQCLKSHAANKAPSLLARHQQHHVSVVTSSLGQSAGNGVFALRAVPEGTALCLYPGAHRIPCGVSKRCRSSIERAQEEQEHNPYLLSLQGGTPGMLDGNPESDGYQQISATGALENPSAVGHLVNHGVDAANVEVATFNWAKVLEGQPVQERYPLPNFLCGSSRDSEPAALGGAVFFALREIEAGEELFVDYGLTNPLPKWAASWYAR
eukprot:TRINITY_DN14844_c0_g1_i1.p1 TRINITY_DN14844_c0_g1~~TRINITY_DN14844_c0_g1_i1.p1  ORF type:complete len:229 (+),score=46.29 TRINITY_DN14844_c0_g1_i1:217-903(+)